MAAGPAPKHALATQGDVDAAARKAREAMVAHERMPIRFERARAQLPHAQLQRRQRQKASPRHAERGAAGLRSVGTPLWAGRVRAELARAEVVPARDLALTPSERRGGRTGGFGQDEQGRRSRVVHQPENGRSKPRADLPQARHQLTRRTRPCHRRALAPIQRYYASAKLRVTAGSTGMPGPVVVETVTFFR